MKLSKLQEYCAWKIKVYSKKKRKPWRKRKRNFQSLILPAKWERLLLDEGAQHESGGGRSATPCDQIQSRRELKRCRIALLPRTSMDSPDPTPSFSSSTLFYSEIWEAPVTKSITAQRKTSFAFCAKNQKRKRKKKKKKKKLQSRLQLHSSVLAAPRNYIHLYIINALCLSLWIFNYNYNNDMDLRIEVSSYNLFPHYYFWIDSIKPNLMYTYKSTTHILVLLFWRQKCN